MASNTDGPPGLLSLPLRGIEALGEAIALVPRVVRIVGDVEKLLVQVSGVIAQVVTEQDRIEKVVERTDRTTHQAAGLVAKTGVVIDAAAAMTDRVGPLLDRFQPALDKLEPILSRLVDSTSPDEVSAMIRLIDTTPDLADKMQADILPILDTLGTVAPDLRDLLDVSKELNEMLSAIPGLGKVKKRLEVRDEPIGEYRADEEPPPAPDRPA